MTVELLWHAFYENGPIVGLCKYNGKKYVFKRENVHIPYEKSTLNIIDIGDDNIENLEVFHKKRREQIGGINDYGEAFKYRVSDGVYCNVNRNIGSYIFPANGILVAIVNYNDIINPYQNTN